MNYIVDKFLNVSIQTIPYSNPKPSIRSGDIICLKENDKIIPTDPSIALFILPMRLFRVREVRGNKISIENLY